MLDGGGLTPARAAELGLVDEVVAPGELIEHALAVAEHLGCRPSAAIAACKRAVYEGGSLPLPDGLRLERAQFLAALGTPEALEAMDSYLRMLDDTGQLPAYDPGAMQKALDTGRFTA